MKIYISLASDLGNNLMFFHSKCGPRMSESAAEKLKNRYVLMRNGAGEHERETGKKTAIPITVRSVSNLYCYPCVFA